jgi:hypothetical protein
MGTHIINLITLPPRVPLALFLFQADSINLKDLAAWGPAVLQLALVLIFLLKIAPVWKEVRLREIALKERDGAIREREAESLGRLADVLQSVAVEQRRATETIEILQRVNADASDHLITNVRMLSERVTRIEDSGGTTLAKIAVDVHKLTTRIGVMEKEHNVESEATTAGA